jgi:RNA polymerase sigma-70 factor (ECF subfamily)
MASSGRVVQLADVRARGARAPAADTTELAEGLRQGEAWAERALLEQHTAHVERILTRILGMPADLDDLVQEVFLRAFQRVEELRDPRALRGFLTAIAVFVAREAIRARRRRRWLVLLPPEETPEIAASAASPETIAAMRAFYDVMRTLDPDARIAFTLRFVEGMELTEIAGACGVSLSTIKRRLKAAEADFTERARADEALATFFEEGTRWPRST